MKNLCVTSSKTPGRGMNTVKVEAEMRICLIQRDAYVVPFFVFKIKLRVSEITVFILSKHQRQIDNAMAEQSKILRFPTTAATAINNKNSIS